MRHRATISYTYALPFFRKAEAIAAEGGDIAILSADAARDLFGDRPLGRTLTLPTPRRENVTATVIGVVGNVSYKGLAEPAEPTLYVPFAQQPWPMAFLVVRTEGDPKALVADLRHAIADVDPRIGTVAVRSLGE